MSITACTTAARHADSIASRKGFERALIDGQGFTHVTYQKGRPNLSAVVHVYIEGDGRPWIRSQIVNHDPTPKKPLMLQLMALDSMPAIYLGRPCYFMHEQDSNCRTEFWTSHRYSEQVVGSMIKALQKLLNSDQSVVLIGHSGGGSIAMLIAARLSQVTSVVTLAGNHDPDAWSQLHGHGPLHGSLNPAKQPALPTTIKQLHVAGGRDNNIPARLIESSIMRQGYTEFVVYTEQSHTCCWEKIWARILSKIE